MFSQGEEEKYILKYFGNKIGKFLDIGAYDGITFSNTYQLLLNGWNGVSVEASPSVFKKLQKNLNDFDIELFNGCISLIDDKIIDFYDNEEATACDNLENVKKWQDVCQFNKINVRTTPILTLLKHYNYKYDFVNIDIEGNSADLFIYIYDLLKYVDMFCIEHDNKLNEIQDIAIDHKLYYNNGENVILVKK